MFLLTDDQIDRIISYRLALLIGGPAWIVLMLLLPRGWAIGPFTAFMLFAIGIFSLTFQKWRTDPGLWMLATFLAVIYGPSFGYFEYLEFESLLKPAPAGPALPRGWNEIRVACDCSLALILLGKTVRFSLSVAVRNWQLTHDPPATR